jgi:hypothetical protein
MSWDDKLIDLENISDKKEEDIKYDELAWPTVRRVKEFRKNVKELVIKSIENINFKTYNPNKANSHELWSILMGICHENIHLETTCPLIRQLPLEYVNRIEELKIAPYEYKLKDASLLNDFKKVKGGIVDLTKGTKKNYC